MISKNRKAPLRSPRPRISAVADHTALQPLPPRQRRRTPLPQRRPQLIGRDPCRDSGILRRLINERISAFDPIQICNRERAVKAIEGLCAVTELDLKLPKGWKEPPAHQTESNCWVCGRFTANDHITKIDEGEGWQPAAGGAVTCSNAVERGNRRYRKMQKTFYRVRTADHIADRVALDLFRDMAAQPRVSTLQLLHAMRAGP